MPVMNFGQPFGSPHRTMMVPAPAGSERAGQAMGEGMARLGELLGMYIGNRIESGRQARDMKKLQEYQDAIKRGPVDLTGQPVGGITGQPGNLPVPSDLYSATPGGNVVRPQMPTFESKKFRQAQSDIALQRALNPQSLSPTQIKSQIQFETYMNAVSKDITDRTPRDQKIVDRYEMGTPLVQIGATESGLKAQAKVDEYKESISKKYGVERGLWNDAVYECDKQIKKIHDDPGFWDKVLPGKNFDHTEIFDAYQKYRINNNYDNLKEPQKKALDNLWDNKIKVWNAAGYKNVGKKEFDWKPNSKEVKALRKPTPPRRLVAPTTGLRSVWSDLTEGQKSEINRRLKEPGYIDNILIPDLQRLGLLTDEDIKDLHRLKSNK